MWGQVNVSFVEKSYSEYIIPASTLKLCIHHSSCVLMSILYEPYTLSTIFAVCFHVQIALKKFLSPTRKSRKKKKNTFMHRCLVWIKVALRSSYISRNDTHTHKAAKLRVVRARLHQAGVVNPVQENYYALSLYRNTPAHTCAKWS